MTSDPWSQLRNHTAARIALGRAGASLPTRELLRFAADHAAARDAVHSEVDWGKLQSELSLGLPMIHAHTRGTDHTTYLQRPDLGRRLDAASVATLEKLRNASEVDVAIIVADGLSALATQTQVAPLLRELIPLLNQSGLTLAPLVLVKLARVAVQDEIGQILHARSALILLGERPGLGSADSLGAYLVFDPKLGNTDANRNCVSNIRATGLTPIHAAHTIHYLLTESLRRKLSGVQLKDERADNRLE